MENPLEPNPFERDMKRIAETLPSKEAFASNPEAQKEAIRAAIKAEALRTETSPSTPTPAASGDSSTLLDDALPSYLSTEPAAVQEAVLKLVQIARAKGLGKALALAKKAPSLVMDAFHDSLVDHLYAELKSRGRL